MPKVTFVQPGGVRQTVDVSTGTSIMHAAVDANIPGIIGECGGAAMCATCHCYVDDAYIGQLPQMSPVEDEMLGITASERRLASRLGCQVTINDDLDGIVVQIPERQV